MDLSISQMMQMQQRLYERNRKNWAPMEPEYGKDFILYMMEEVGEVIAILKKKGSGAIASEPEVRQAFLEEMADVLMYYHEILLRFGVTSSEISEAYTHKHLHNLERDYHQEYEELHFNG